MMSFGLLAVHFIMSVVAVFFVICCVALVLLILIQKGRGGGLSAAFGGGGMASGILGSKTGDFLTWVTIVMVGVFLTLAVVMGKYYRPSVGGSGEETPIRREQPVDTRQAVPVEVNMATASDANSPVGDANLPGG